MATRSQPAPLPSFEQARHTVEEQARTLRPGAAEVVALLRARGRVLVEPLIADRDFPPFPRATRDGYAVRAADLASLPASLRVVGEIRAGVAPAPGLALAAGQAVEIMTGAPVPAGADAVVMVEYTERRGDSVGVQRAVAAGENVVPTGIEAKQGAVVVNAGTRLDAVAIALAAAVGCAQVRVHARPRVAILPTGDELVEIAVLPASHQIRNSNSYSLAAQVEAAGAQPVQLPIAADEAVQLRKLIEQGLSSDLLLLSGGVSMGKYDLVEQVLAELKAEFFFTGAQIQPGRPVVFGRASRKPGTTPTCFFGLPGNPVSTLVCFELFARPVLDALSGAAPAPLAFVQARLASEIRTKTGLTRFLPATLSGQNGPAEVEPVRWQGSGDMVSLTRANCYIVVPPDRERLPAGEPVSVLMR
ncbi:MAG TPA: gephyrin-like molybdotransferase Glp [Terriglobales bacterium]|jgi:molybdopterin molybdotransferase|nr:gephyrin-like molybdotransferase Glp [Terriglobales bacterium]